ncbi:MAG: 50S ribosomal protein L11 methyltransferase [Vicinamibacteria bacterium]
MEEKLFRFLHDLGASGTAQRLHSKEEGDGSRARPISSPLAAYFHATRGEMRRVLRKIRALRSFRAKLFEEPSVDWARRSQESFLPVRPTPRLVLHPPWSRPRPVRGEKAICLHPGSAFGLGTHASTVLCLRTIDCPETMGKRFLDVGTGTGVLALAAEVFGASQVFAIDNDPEACRNAARNLTANRKTKRIRLACATLDAIRKGRFDVVVANLDRREIVSRMGDLLGMIRRDGELRIAGILRRDEPILRKSVARENGRIAGVDVRDGWLLAIVRRRGSPFHQPLGKGSGAMLKLARPSE